MRLTLSDGRHFYKRFITVGNPPGLGSLLRIIPSPRNVIRTLWIPRKNEFKDFIHLQEFRKIQDGAHVSMIGRPIEAYYIEEVD